MNKKPKLLFLVTEDWYFCSHRIGLAKAAQATGFDVIVVTRVNQHGDVIRELGFQLIPLDFNRGGLNPFQEVKTLLVLWRIYRHIQPDIVHHIALKPVLYGGLIARFNPGVKVVGLVAGLGAVFSSDRIKARLLRSLIKPFLRFIWSPANQRVIVQNREDRQLLENSLGLPRDKVKLIRGSGVDIQQFRVVPEPDGEVVVALVSRLLWDKGVGEFVEAVKLLKEKGVSFRALLVGKPDPENMASVNQAQLDIWQSAGDVECIGFVYDIARFWQTAHIAVLPSYREGLPKSLLEAAASGRPIVTTDTAGCNEIVKQGDNGLLVPVKDIPALAEAMEKLILDAVLRQKMGRAGRKRVEQEFSASIVMAQTLNVYRELM